MKHLLSIESADLDQLADLVAARVTREVAELLQAQPESAEMFTVSEVAVRFGISERTIRRAITSGALHVERIGRSVRISREDLDRWKSQRRRTAVKNDGSYNNAMKRGNK